MFHVATALYFVVLSLGLVTLVAPFNYIDQNQWTLPPGSQCGGMRQSPINIVPAQVNGNDALKPLTFYDYDKPLDGVFENIGTTVQFVPNTRATMAVSTHKGIYDLQEIQFHWGSDETEGSEHQFSGIKYAAEIQFVHLKRNAPGSTDQDAYAIVSVLADSVTVAPVANPVWNDLSVPTGHATSNTVSGSSTTSSIVSSSSSQYENLLPTNRDYYYYEGSFTTPPCTENVQWFVFKKTIDIPEGFLDDLRLVKTDASGTLLTFNFRDLQNLNSRSVFKRP